MKLTPDEFRAYLWKNKIASAEVVEQYMVDNRKAEYVYDDIEAVYQKEVDKQQNKIVVHCKSELLPGTWHSTYDMGGGCYHTKTGIKSGRNYQKG